MKPVLFIAIHGILTSQSAHAWQEEFAAYVQQRPEDGGPRLDVLTREYWAGTFPALNVFLLNHFLAGRVADEIIYDWLDGYVNEPEICFIAHSNGADIAIKTIQLLANAGQATKAAIFIAGAVNPDIQKNGIARLRSDGWLENAFAYCSRGDEVLRDIPGFALWPYGRLGFSGFRDGDSYADPRIAQTRWYPPEFNHGTYFDDRQRAATYERAIADCLT